MHLQSLQIRETVGKSIWRSSRSAFGVWQNEDNLKNEDDINNENNFKKWRRPKNEEDLKNENEDNIKNQNDLKNKDDLKKICPLPYKNVTCNFFW